MTSLPLARAFTDSFGVDITFYEWPVSEAKAVVQLVHGLGEHARRYEHLIRDLNRAGYHVYASDHRGHGQTGVSMRAAGLIAKQGQLGPGGMKAAITDELELTSIIEREQPELPIVIIAQSWGSLITQRILDTDSYRYSGVVLTGSTVALPVKLPNGGDDSKFVERGTTPKGGEWLSRKPGVAEAFRNDPLNFPESGLKIWGLLQASKLLGLPKRGINPELPMLLMCGTEDQLGGERYNPELQKHYMKAGVEDVALIMYHGARHEVFHEINYDEVLGDLVAWLDGEFEPVD
jgi:alpha-beta hydrolase superfamily lysophospholipase